MTQLIRNKSSRSSPTNKPRVLARRLSLVFCNENLPKILCQSVATVCQLFIFYNKTLFGPLQQTPHTFILTLLSVVHTSKLLAKYSLALLAFFFKKTEKRSNIFHIFVLPPLIQNKDTAKDRRTLETRQLHKA